MTRIYLGVGTNTRREHHLHRGLDALQQLLGPLQLSPVFESDAVGILGARFYNLIMAADTPLPLADLNEALMRLEVACGRREQNVPGRVALKIEILLSDELSSCRGGWLLACAEIKYRTRII